MCVKSHVFQQAIWLSSLLSCFCQCERTWKSLFHIDSDTDVRNKCGMSSSTTCPFCFEDFVDYQSLKDHIIRCSPTKSDIQVYPGKKMLKDIVVKQETKKVPQLPYDINVTMSYKSVASNRAKLLKKLKNGRPSEKDSRTMGRLQNISVSILFWVSHLSQCWMRLLFTT